MGWITSSSFSWRHLLCSQQSTDEMLCIWSLVLHVGGYVACTSNARLVPTLIANCSLTPCLTTSLRTNAVLRPVFYTCYDDILSSVLKNFSKVFLRCHTPSGSVVIQFRRHTALQYPPALLTRMRHCISHFP